ncbi:MAG: phage major capsid protein [Eubacteriales bacterium]
MLKQLRTGLMLEKAKRSLAELLGQRKCFEERKADIEKRFADAGAASDADIETIENDLTALEKEVEEADIDKKISDEEAEIQRLEKELSEIGKQTPPDGTGSEPSGTEPNNNKGAENMERKSTARKYELRKRLTPFVERDNVKKWLNDIRALGKGETRAVTGAELNIPTEVMEPIREKIEEYSKLIKYVNFKPVKGKARQPIIATVPEAVWTEMKGVLNELELVFNVMEVDGYKIAGFVPVPNYILNDSDINLLVEIIDIIGKSLGRGIDKAIVYGNGKKTLLGTFPDLRQKPHPVISERARRTLQTFLHPTSESCLLLH